MPHKLLVLIMLLIFVLTVNVKEIKAIAMSKNLAHLIHHLDVLICHVL